MSVDPPVVAASPAGSLEVSSSRGALTMALAGRLDVQSVGGLWRTAVAALDTQPPERLVVDAVEVDYCDGAGIGLLLKLLQEQQRPGVTVEIRGLADEYDRLLQPFAGVALEVPGARKSPAAIVQLGRATVQFGRDMVMQIAFIGELATALLSALVHLRRWRWRDAFMVAERAGVDALPIVALISFLIGLILGFQSAVALRPFGGDIFVPSLVGIVLVRELAPLMTAIILAGRTGSAFAAEIGTMKVNEEVDALTTMGLDPVRFLVVTRVAAIVMMTPMLALLANLAGLIGGAVVFLSLGYPLVTYTAQIESTITLTMLFGGLFKTFFFGLIIGAIGCLRGLQTQRGASAVGISATRAVVSGIFLIIVADGLFAVAYYQLGI